MSEELSWNKLFLVGILSGIITALIILFVVFNTEADQYPKGLQLGNQNIEIEVADSPEERTQGLSGRSELQEGKGLLFIFEEDDRHGFWMKDMLFSIDIIWLNRDFRVVHLEKNVNPDTYPQVFRPDSPARYVLEIPAGQSEEVGIKKGIQFSVTY